MIGLELEDKRISIRLSEANNGTKARWTITYPKEPRYREMVQAALCEFLYPGSRQAIRANEETKIHAELT